MPFHSDTLILLRLQRRAPCVQTGSVLLVVLPAPSPLCDRRRATAPLRVRYKVAPAAWRVEHVRLALPTWQWALSSFASGFTSTTATVIEP